MLHDQIDALRKKAEEYLGNASYPSRQAWGDHPCTKWLLTSMMADQLELIEEWKVGAYHGEDSSMNVDVALGMARALDDVEATVRDVSKDDTEEDEHSSGGT
jgi:hypothetical protein